MTGNLSDGSRENPPPSDSPMDSDRSRKARGHNPDVHGGGKSDKSIVPEKSANKEQSAESMEGRDVTFENAVETQPVRAQTRKDGRPLLPGSRGLNGIRQAANRDKSLKFNNLYHHLTLDLLKASFLGLKRYAAPGVDDVIWTEYAIDYEERLVELHQRIHRGSYRAQPSKRAYIAKADGKQRPLGIAALEDKIVQAAVRTILEQIYEVDFKDFSYGYRPHRGAHDGLDEVYVEIKHGKVNWILDADIRGFFDNIDHTWMMTFLEHRVTDWRILRLVKKWLTAGVSEDGKLSKTTVGTPQGSVISPLLANIYLHYVLDLWAEQWKRTEGRGHMFLVRYADDFVVGFQLEATGQQFLADLKERMAKFGLELHPEKTRLIEFGRFAESDRKHKGGGRPETFDFLGFTHICGQTRKGHFQLERRTAKKKFQAKLAAIKQQLRREIHNDIRDTGKWLKSVYDGWCRYYAVPGNYLCLSRFQDALQTAWLRLLRRRSQRGKKLTWKKFAVICNRWLPNPRILHPYPEGRRARRLTVTHPR